MPTELERLAALVTFSPDAIVLFDADGVIEWASPSTPDVLGYPAADLAGVRVHDLVDAEDRAVWIAFMQSLFDRPAAALTATLRCRHKDGSVRWTEAVGRNLLGEPSIAAIVVRFHDVSARKRTEMALQASEDRYSRLIESADDVIFEADDEGYFRFVNPATLRVFGYRADQVIGRRFTEFIRPDFRPTVFQHYATQVKEGRLMSYIEFPAITAAGEEVWLGQKAWMIFGPDQRFRGMQAMARDITERHRATEALRQAEAKYRTLVEQSLMAVYIVQHDRLVYVNPKGADLLGYANAELLAMPNAFALVHEQDRAFVIDQLARLGPGHATVHLTVRGLRSDGTSIQVEAFCATSEYGGQPAVLATVLDISDRVRLEDQLRQAQKMEAVGRLAGGIAHDFNNLLTAIRGNAELMLDRVKQNPAMAADMEEILHASDRAATLTRQLLAFSRKQVFQPVPLNLNDVVSTVSRMARRLIGTDVQLRLDLAPDLARVLADPAQIEQVLLNLIVNARDAMPNGGTITAGTSTVTLAPGAPEASQTGLAPGPYVRLTVADNGIGMDQATQARIFEPFFTTKEPGRGTGLGLSTVYGIVRQTGGAVTVSSERNHGAIFSVLLPAVPGDYA